MKTYKYIQLSKEEQVLIEAKVLWTDAEGSYRPELALYAVDELLKKALGNFELSFSDESSESRVYD